jgi:hypothetical protein
VSQLFDRRAWIQISSQRFIGLHLRFKVTKTLTGDANTADISVFNLSTSSRAAIPAANIPVILVAGYKDATEVIFAGDVRTVDHKREGADWVTHLRAGDGEACFERAYCVKSFGPGTELSGVLDYIAGQMGISVKDAVQKIRTGGIATVVSTYLQGVSLQGRAVRELDRVTKAAGVEWSIQDGTLQLLEPGKTTNDPAVLLSPKTGLIASPDHGKPQRPGEPSYLKAKSLLNGGLRPGRAVQLDSEGHRGGQYRVQKVEHQGELDGPSWYSEVYLTPRAAST